MTKKYEIIGGWAYQCDMCEEEGMPTLLWAEKDFNLCYQCVEKLFIKYVSHSLKKGEKIIVKRAPISEELRNELLKEAEYKCSECQSDKLLEVDHKIPFSKGGTTQKSNLQILCKSCNIKKRNG